ncbi:MAG: Fic family protein [Chloroflexota bacterium]|nr:Fic family protein [Chloroflexota bacterium]
MEFSLTADISDIDTDSLFRRLYEVRTLIPGGYEPYFRERARYLSTLASAKVEGNPLGYEEARVLFAGEGDPVRPEERELTNLHDAYGLMEQLAADATVRIDQGLLRAMNSLILEGLPDEMSRRRGQYRAGPSLIEDAESREIRYRPPPPAWVPDLMDRLVAHIQQWTAEESFPPPIIAALAHAGLVAIHPFEEGTGRTARLLADMILHQAGWSEEGMLVLNVVIWRNRDSYYQALRDTHGLDFRSDVDGTPFAAFHTDALRTAAAMLEHFVVSFKGRQDAWREEFGTRLNERQTLGLTYIIDTGSVSSSMYARLIGASPSTAYADLTHLVSCGAAVRSGKGRNTRYAANPDLLAQLIAAVERSGWAETYVRKGRRRDSDGGDGSER